MEAPMETDAIGAIFSSSLGVAPSDGVSRPFEQCIGQIVVPGMILGISTSEMSKTWHFGTGLAQVPARSPSTNKVCVLVRKLGILCHVDLQQQQQQHDARQVSTASPPSLSAAASLGNRAWVDSLPLSPLGGARASLCGAPQSFHASQFSVGDRVIGVVKKKAGELYHLDIGTTAPASLNCLSFEGASKKNRPDLRLRDVIYAAISQTDPDLEIELTCVDEAGKASGMGILGRHEPGSVGNAGGMNGGVMLTGSLELVRRLADTTNFPLLAKLSQKFSFEICLGCNGRIWLTGSAPRETMLLANTISLADYVAPEVCLRFVEELC